MNRKTYEICEECKNYKNKTKPHNKFKKKLKTEKTEEINDPEQELKICITKILRAIYIYI